MLLLKMSGYGAMALAALSIILAAVEGFVPFLSAAAALFAAGAGFLGLNRIVELLDGIRSSLPKADLPASEAPSAEAPVQVRSIEEIEAGIARLKAR